MSFYFKNNTDSIYHNIDNFSKAASDLGYKFFDWNGDLYYKDKVIGKFSRCVNENEGLSDKYIFNISFFAQKRFIQLRKCIGR